MAKDTKLTADEKKRKEALAKEEKERQKKAKEIEAKKKKKIKQHQSKINALVSYPYNVLLQLALILGIMAFVYFYLWNSSSLITSLLYLFFVFSTIYLGGGLLMLGYYFVKSEVKRRELDEQIKNEKQKREQEEIERQAKEMEELEAIEKELLAKRIASKMEKKAIQETSSKSQNHETSSNNDSNDLNKPMGTMKNDELDDNDSYLEELLNSDYKKQ